MPNRLGADSWVRVCGAVAIAAVVATICGCDAGAPVATASSRTEPRPERGGTLRLISEAPASLDPAWVGSVYESLPVGQIFDTLVTVDPRLNVLPCLAEDWVVSRDGLTYTFRLRDDVRFHDGAPLTAADVVYTVRRLIAPDRTHRSIAESHLSVLRGASEFESGRRGDLFGVTAPDDRTVVFRLERPSVSFFDLLASDALRVVSRRVVERVGEEAHARAPVGTGPFVLERWDPDGITLTANHDYFRGAPFLDGVRIRFTRPDERDRGLSRFEAGEIDVVEAGPGALDALEGRSDVTIVRQQELGVWFLGINTAYPGLDDPRVRRAIAHAVDREALAGLAPAVRHVAGGILPPGLAGYTPAPTALAHDPARSRSLLLEAGFGPGGGPITFPMYVARTSLFDRATVEHLRDDLDRVGIGCEVVEVGWNELSRRIDDHAAPLFLVGWIADLLDPDAFLRSLFFPEGSANFFLLSDPEVASLLDRGAMQADPVARAMIYRETESRILEAAPLIPLFHSVAVIAYRPRVHGIEPGPLGLSAIDLERVWIDGRSE